MEAIGSINMPVSGLGAHLDHLWDMEVVCCFQPSLYDLRIVVKKAQKLASGLFGSNWKHNYASELTPSPFRPFMGHGGRLPFSTVAVRFTHCGENGPETS